ncbi:helix-turn-helix domain-containing protein [Salmonella enterica]|uniref:Helix-turn-helix domain-containing protein n=1 Tax=Salmonella enterica TaxID=28901 RepID=A0A5U2F5U2_SALER|nr:helix-turn-helix domain-containing protein [Salmonella enterica]
MRERGLNMSELAKEVGLSHTAIRNWVNGHAVASGDRLTRLAIVVDRPEYWFFMEQVDGNEDARKGRALSERDILVVNLFNQLPEIEQLRLIVHIEATIQEVAAIEEKVSGIARRIGKKTYK